MTAGKELEAYLGDRYGASGIIVRDPRASAGLREWSREDTRELGRWIEEREEAGRQHKPLCHNLSETARLAGVGIQTAQAWIRRRDNPLPHFRDGRRILIPHSTLVQWLEEETARTGSGKTEPGGP